MRDINYMHILENPRWRTVNRIFRRKCFMNQARYENAVRGFILARISFIKELN